MQKTLGGDRLGAGNKLKVELHNYERSTHDLGYIWRSTMAAGTLVPFMKEIALPGDTFDIDLNCDIKTHPTLAPLFASFKVQLDVFQAPIRLYQGQLHNNKLGIGMKMSTVKLPYWPMRASQCNADTFQNIDLDNYQVNPSCILSYLGIRGVGFSTQSGANRKFNGVPLLAYWDIYKNYYANKQEEIGAVIHTPIEARSTHVTDIHVTTGATTTLVPTGSSTTIEVITGTTTMDVAVGAGQTQDLDQLVIYYKDSSHGSFVQVKLTDYFTFDHKTGDHYFLNYTHNGIGFMFINQWVYQAADKPGAGNIQVHTFPLSNIDDMREQILAAATSSAAFDINATGLEPYVLIGQRVGDLQAMQFSQEGLALKTYQSDLFNNWLQTEWIDGVDGINAITAVDTSGGSFNIDTIILARKVYDMLNRIAVSGGTYQDWLDAVYTNETNWRCESPMYMGGLIKELVFQEVVSNSTSEAGGQPLGTLAGKGVLAGKHKGGKVTIKVDEPSYIIGIISLTPRLDYSQGNDWDTHLVTVDDLHKPALDQIGFQELITEQMAWWNTYNTTGGDGDWVTVSAGKQPAWINYMTNINKVRGNFAIQNNEMFMTLNRRYTPVKNGTIVDIEDLTTYIDPSKFNSVFAQTSLDSQNFWAQIAVDMTVRRKISAKVIPNL